MPLKDSLPMFTALVKLDTATGKYKATCQDFPRMQGYGETPEAARNSLRRIVVEVWSLYRA